MIAFVAATRADARSRRDNVLRTALEHNLTTASAAAANVVFVVVEWGDHTDGIPVLREQLGDLPVLVLSVPSRIADKHQTLGFFAEYTAKNVGLRWACDRLSATLVVAYNVDDFFSPALLAALATLEPSSEYIYRAPRWDFTGDLTTPVWTTKWTIGDGGGEAAGDFTGFTPAAWQQLEGYWQSPRHRIHLDSELVLRARNAGRRLYELPPVWHRDHVKMCKTGDLSTYGQNDDDLRMGYGQRGGGGKNWGLVDELQGVLP